MRTLCSSYSGSNQCSISFPPFVEAVEVADYIKERADPEDRVLVLGSEPEILFYAGLKSVTKHVYMYDLMYPTETAAGIQDELIAAAELHEPKYVVFKSVYPEDNLFSRAFIEIYVPHYNLLDTCHWED